MPQVIAERVCLGDGPCAILAGFGMALARIEIGQEGLGEGVQGVCGSGFQPKIAAPRCWLSLSRSRSLCDGIPRAIDAARR